MGTRRFGVGFSEEKGKARRAQECAAESSCILGNHGSEVEQDRSRHEVHEGSLILSSFLPAVTSLNLLLPYTPSVEDFSALGIHARRGDIYTLPCVKQITVEAAV